MKKHGYQSETLLFGHLDAHRSNPIHCVAPGHLAIAMPAGASIGRDNVLNVYSNELSQHLWDVMLTGWPSASLGGYVARSLSGDDQILLL